MTKLIATQGLPASGKSTWVLKELEKNPSAIRVNRDQLRLMMGHQFNPKIEKRVTWMGNKLIREGLADGFDVYADETCLSDKRLNELKAMAADCTRVRGGVPFEVKSFMDVSVEQCIKRDAERSRSVGKDVIERMYYDYWKHQPKPVNAGNLNTIICDLDGTLALIPSGANPYDRDFTKDILNPAVFYLLMDMHRTSHVTFMSGRHESARSQTEAWLQAQGWNFNFCAMHMRDDGDNRKDTVVKKEMYLNNVQGKYHVEFVALLECPGAHDGLERS